MYDHKVKYMWVISMSVICLCLECNGVMIEVLFMINTCE